MLSCVNASCIAFPALTFLETPLQIRTSWHTFSPPSLLLLILYGWYSSAEWCIFVIYTHVYYIHLWIFIYYVVLNIQSEVFGLCSDCKACGLKKHGIHGLTRSDCICIWIHVYYIGLFEPVQSNLPSCEETIDPCSAIGENKQEQQLVAACKNLKLITMAGRQQRQVQPRAIMYIKIYLLCMPLVIRLTPQAKSNLVVAG